ncbi:uncharacterized protein LOC106639048 [Copidosoma floridanum]|uniref:uncharacterized protein LOC106639048 n=1 Tax=Copidosoma floridanum TaxID=29053 RepID=UPI0006C9468F|nr:uncharacterized protein LOC106639048 [Copidosoma floridanum]
MLTVWIETDSLDGDVSQLVTATKKISVKRCCKNSLSSGYSSHSPPLSATIGTSAKALAPIREGEIIPRPIWPMSPSDDSSVENSSPDTASSDDAGREGNNRRQESLYGSAGYRSSCEASSSDYGGASNSSGALSARDVLLELSRTLSSVLEGDCPKSDEEILRDITRTVAVAQVVGAAGVGGADAEGDDGGRRASPSIYEEIYRNNAGSLASSARESSSTAGMNPINSRLYGHRCYCERSVLCQSRPGSVQPSPKSADRKAQCPPSVYLLRGAENSFVTCNCKGYDNGPQQDRSPGKKGPCKQSRNNQNDGRPDKDARFNYPSIAEHEYTTLQCSDEYSSSSATSNHDGSKSNTWNKDFRGFDKNLDFTLDALHAERLGRAIARAKRRRRWCCVFVIVFGLVFFVLVVIVVSLAVTKGRKVFGSM